MRSSAVSAVSLFPSAATRWPPAAACALAGILVAAPAAAQHSASAAGGGQAAERLTLSNASFEDIPRQGNAPRGWFDCGFPGETPVDVHPAAAVGGDTSFFGVDNMAFDGNTYLGMVVRDNDTYEAVSQRLGGGMLRAGSCYTFSVYLARETGYFSGSKLSVDEVVNYDTPARLRIWGGSSYCNRGELIAETSPVENAEWLEYTFRFEPKRDHGYLVLEAFYDTPVLFAYNGNLLVDFAGDIAATPCDETDIPEADPALVAEADAALPEADDAVPEADPPPAADAGAVASIAEADAAPPPVRPARPRPTTAPAESDARLQGLTREQLRTGSVVRVEKLYFKADSSVVMDVSTPVLEEIYAFLEANPDVVIEVGGHTNMIPPHEFCDWLSQERARFVVEYLVGRGIDADRLTAVGYGKRRPVTRVKTVGAQKRNQRVELKVLSMG